MSSLLRLLRFPLVIILLVSVFALIFVAYTQHQEQQYWRSRYITELQKYTEEILQDYKKTGLLLAIRLIHFDSATDITETKSTNSLHQEIKPLAIELYSGLDYVAFWFSRDDISNGQILIHLPSWPEDYRPITLPFIECFPEDQHCESHL
jgi:hypothetical protein